ncbi:hypothetical protein [Streptomyces sp. NPDC059893]|uniref:hypothetical protein n=1 Tax=Streptomyces sp. NPDC059893 TaxID=3346990 RepID=UPI00365E3898
MADATAVFSMISGLGGAALGALAGVYGPVLLERRQHSTQQSSDAHTTVATARQAGHAWLRAVHRTVQDLQAGRAVDIPDFDQITEAAMETVTAAITELARPSVELHRVPSGAADLTGPVIARMWEITRQLRKVVLALADASWLDDIEAQAQKTRDALGHLLQSEIEVRTGHPLHVAASQQAGPSVYGYPTPYSPATPPNVPPPPGDSSATNQP